MLAESTSVKVVASYPDGSQRIAEYDAGQLEGAARAVLGSQEVSTSDAWPGFCCGFAAALDVLGSGLLSSAFPLGTAIRAYVDVMDPVEMPGHITDIGRIAGDAA